MHATFLPFAGAHTTHVHISVGTTLQKTSRVDKKEHIKTIPFGQYRDPCKAGAKLPPPPPPPALLFLYRLQI